MFRPRAYIIALLILFYTILCIMRVYTCIYMYNYFRIYIKHNLFVVILLRLLLNTRTYTYTYVLFSRHDVCVCVRVYDNYYYHVR